MTDTPILQPVNPLAEMTIRQAHDHLARDGLRLCGRCSLHQSAFRRYLCPGCFSDLAQIKRERLRKDVGMPLGHSTIHEMMVMGNV